MAGQEKQCLDTGNELFAAINQEYHEKLREHLDLMAKRKALRENKRKRCADINEQMFKIFDEKYREDVQHNMKRIHEIYPDDLQRKQIDEADEMNLEELQHKLEQIEKIFPKHLDDQTQYVFRQKTELEKKVKELTKKQLEDLEQKLNQLDKTSITDLEDLQHKHNEEYIKRKDLQDKLNQFNEIYSLHLSTKLWHVKIKKMNIEDKIKKLKLKERQQNKVQDSNLFLQSLDTYIDRAYKTSDPFTRALMNYYLEKENKKRMKKNRKK